ncbi:MAG: MutS protein msh5 [Watsoniomyces obsoletus]|nr:MAG: MutS protein msh5 [Watsoniomyces obsoletus]
MSQQESTGAVGPGGRRLHIAHRRSPSELTPLMSQQLAIQQQLESINQQQQQLSFTYQQYANLGMLPPQQHLNPAAAFGPVPGQMQGQVPNVSPNMNAFQFPQQQQQQQQVASAHLNVPTQGSSHRRNQSALPNMSMGPPPAPSSGAAAAGGAFGEFGAAGAHQRENDASRGGRGGHGGGPSGGGGGGGGHQRRHSLALPEAKKAAELREQKRTTSGFQFPIPTAGKPTASGGAAAEASPTEADDKVPSGPPATATAPAAGLNAAQAGLNARSGNRGGAAHNRSQSAAIGSNGRATGHGRAPSGFQFPAGGAASNDAASVAAAQQQQQQDFQRRGSQGNHARNASRNFEGNWRQQGGNHQASMHDPQASMGQFNPGQSPNLGGGGFQPGHRVRASMGQSIGSLGAFQYAAQPQLIQLPSGQVVLGQQQQLFPGQQLNPMQLNQLQALQAAQLGGQPMAGLAPGPHGPAQLSAQQQQQQQQQQRKTLFTPYLPQANLPALLNDGQLVSGVLRVNKKNRSDAYVSTQDGLLDADIFICGSKDRNRALEGDLVAVELLDVDDVWSQKREKEEKKKRKDITDSRNASAGAPPADKPAGGDTDPNGSRSNAAEGGLRRRGSLRQRPTQKKNDDVEVEGQSLLLMEEEEVNDEQKPLYAGHVVAVIERIAGQMFSGTLGLLRPSSQATKEKQEAERQARDGGGRHAPERQQEKPKIVWFKPTDKRVPLIAIPTEQAPRDFVEKHQDYANRIFVACIKRWPITSLHPFGTLVEQLGEMGNLKVETDALLRDNNFSSDEFSDAVLRSINLDDWSVASEGEAALAARRDLREEQTFTIDPDGAEDLSDAIHLKIEADHRVEVGIHVADVAHFVKPNSLVDREAKKRGTAVHLVNRAVNLLPPKIASDVCSLNPGQEKLAVSVIFHVDATTGQIGEQDVWMGKSIIKSSGKLTYSDVDAVLGGRSTTPVDETLVKTIHTVQKITQAFRAKRLGCEAENVQPLTLLHLMDDENIPVEHNIFESSPSRELVEELTHKANELVAKKLAAGLPNKALLRRQASPNPRRLQTFVERMTRLGFDMDISTSGKLQQSLFQVEDAGLRTGMETLLVKAMQRAQYFIAGRVPEHTYPHYALNLPLYTHFAQPTRRYADIVVQRQLEAVLSNGAVEFADEAESLVKTAEHCNHKKDCAMSAQEQSVHIESCRSMDKKRQELGTDLISEGIVICVYESAFDVLIPEYGFEKRVHCDQLPLKKAEFDKNKRILELYWEKGVPSSAYVPEDERPKAGSAYRGGGGGHAAGRDGAAQQAAKERDDAQQRQMEPVTMSSDDVDALFEDEDDPTSEATGMMAGVSLNQTSSGNDDAEQGPEEASPATKPADRTDGAPEAQLTNKEKYAGWFSLREEKGQHIQDVTEMTRVPVILKTDLTKSPPCLTIRSLNPYAL